MSLFTSAVGYARGAVRAARRFRQAVTLWPEAVRRVRDPELSRTYYPEAERKSRLQMAAENVRYVFRHGQLDKYYFSYGMDRKGARTDSVVPYPTFWALRDGANEALLDQGHNYVCLLRDKFVFAQFASSLGYPTPRNLAFLSADAVESISTRESAPLDALLEDDVDGICKPFDGTLGRGVFMLRVEDGDIFVDGRPASLDDLRARLGGRSILQERVDQHPVLAGLHPASLNTLRIVTVMDRGEVRVFTAHLRIGQGGALIDSWGLGSLAVTIDPEAGALKGKGLVRAGTPGWVTHHPDTGVELDGLALPFFDEGVELVRRLHQDIRYVHTVGWDVAMTPTGPSIIEGNDRWGASTVMALEPDFKDRFLALFD
ncbi:sugar-transfer associated ATP-grasp domain-containing protein [Rubrivirga sp. S365]|uniref:sugar-transfer associated ATP-grasp domain-containing protein n=1 Tax=Rubrivirga sp. S365 TaxID=3076080 RepID=UPI0028C76F88|nr:sugar-transfer associated ATP-grasp domain-containing protein [Rubrivirga sp. S365]MDT7857588.1 sugar-transfer associated ATP-grasp domain-containing protein [Rubrivirga sp. S365]